MTIALIAAVLLVAYLIVDGIRKDRRITDLEASYRLERAATDAAHRGQVAELVAVIATERDARREEVADLCQRLQAPELAIVRHDVERATDEPAGAAPLADEDFFREHQETAEHIARLEELENAPFDRV